jgi:hypothetical protein
LTDKQIEREAIKHSTNWTEAGSGELGKLYVEIMGCDNLPNLDFGTLDFRDKTDAFACLIFEDSVVNTDVIGDSLSPRWMPWSRRAFVFNIDHPSSDLQIGIFDHDRELSPLQLVSRLYGDDLHDPVGRIQINTSNFLPNTVYTLTVRTSLRCHTHRFHPHSHPLFCIFLILSTTCSTGISPRTE